MTAQEKTGRSPARDDPNGRAHRLAAGGVQASWLSQKQTMQAPGHDLHSAFWDLIEPRALAGESVRLAGGLARVATGTSHVAPAPRDKRFSDPAWAENPLYKRWAQAYLVWSQSMQRLASRPALREDWKREARARAAADRLIGAAAPSNLLLGNPAALKRALDTGGISLVRGARNAARDLVRHRGMPEQVDTAPFKVGE